MHTDLEPAHLLGVLSILFWMLMVVVSFKYVMLVLRADNRGEAARWRCWSWPCAAGKGACAGC